MNKKQLIGALVIFACIAFSPKYTDKKYPVNHTEGEWVRNINALIYVQSIVNRSEIPARDAFTCDSLLQAQILDINKQVVAAMMADSTQKKKP